MNTRISEINVPRISWGAVFAGFFLGAAAYLVLSVLGTAIGASVISPMRAGSFGGFPIGAAIWLAVMTLASTSIGGFVAGRTAHASGELHGLLTWAVTTLVTTYLFAALAGGMLGTAFGFAGRTASVAGLGIAKLAPSVASAVKGPLEEYGVTLDFDSLQDQLERLIRQAAPAQDAQSGSQKREDISRLFDRLKHKTDPKLNAADKDLLVDIIVTHTDKDRQEAQRMADDYIRIYNDAVARYDKAKERASSQAREMAEMGARGASRAAWWTFGVLVICAIVSTITGRVGFAGQQRGLVS